MCKKCNECFYFVSKSKELPFNAFDYIAGNETGICLNYHDQPVEWVSKEYCEFIPNKEIKHE